jgi:hypothetical protein
MNDNHIGMRGIYEGPVELMSSFSEVVHQ